MKLHITYATVAAMIAIASLTVCPPSYADDWDDPGEDPGEDPGGGPQPGDPAYCDTYGHWWVFQDTLEPTCEYEGCDHYTCVNCGDWDERNITPPRPQLRERRLHAL
ncbi:MAG: hypothetical protein IKF72_00945 [Kiritimatiellae bacterium]|nr:hypothetical protein [Kiritimatiellia bacterium]